METTSLHTECPSSAEPEKKVLSSDSNHNSQQCYLNEMGASRSQNGRPKNGLKNGVGVLVLLDGGSSEEDDSQQAMMEAIEAMESFKVMNGITQTSPAAEDDMAQDDDDVAKSNTTDIIAASDKVVSKTTTVITGDHGNKRGRRTRKNKSTTESSKTLSSVIKNITTTTAAATSTTIAIAETTSSSSSSVQTSMICSVVTAQLSIDDVDIAKSGKSEFGNLIINYIVPYSIMKTYY